MRAIKGPFAVRTALARTTLTRRRVSRALVLAVAAFCGSLLMAGVANASPQSVTFLGANPANGSSINLGPASSCLENGGWSNYCPNLTVQDATAEWYNPTTQAWQPAYDVGIHPWGEVSGTSSWINCGPSLFDCVNTTSTYRVRFTVPSDWTNPSMTLTARADNIVSVTLNGQTLISNAVGGNGFQTSTEVPSLSAGVNELRFIVTDQGGITGFNYRADLTYDASSGSAVVGAGDPAPTTGCTAGTYSATGGAPCQVAPAGTYVSSSWATSATPCPAGTYSASAGSSSCTAAPAGTYVSAAGAASATPCPAGTYSASAGSSACTPAPAETYVSAAGASTPTPCPADTTTNGQTGQTACVPIPPTITLQAISPAANGNGWHDGPVTVTWTCTHSTSATVSTTLSGDGANQSATGTCVSSVDSSQSVSDTQSGISIDQAKPTLAPTVSPSPAALGGTATASANASDALSGIESSSCGAVDTSSLGTHTVTCTATDKAGNAASATVSYDVTGVATKQAVLDGIRTALASASKDDADKLREAARKLSDALTPGYWTDANHPSSKRVFEDEKQAVQALGELLKDRDSQIADATLQGWIDSLVGLDRAMASLAIHDAAAGDSHQLGEAAEELARGDSEAAKGHLDAALEHYGNAWQQAQKSQKAHRDH